MVVLVVLPFRHATPDTTTTTAACINRPCTRPPLRELRIHLVQQSPCSSSALGHHALRKCAAPQCHVPQLLLCTCHRPRLPATRLGGIRTPSKRAPHDRSGRVRDSSLRRGCAFGHSRSWVRVGRYRSRNANAWDAHGTPRWVANSRWGIGSHVDSRCGRQGLTRSAGGTGGGGRRGQPLVGARQAGQADWVGTPGMKLGAQMEVSAPEFLIRQG